jgi:hypothetical protein
VFAHIAGIPIEEGLLGFAPIAGLGLGYFIVERLKAVVR